MERIFWAECPGCHGKFYCNYQDMRHSSTKLMCPFCRARFTPEEAAWLDESAPAGEAPKPPDRPNVDR